MAYNLLLMIIGLALLIKGADLLVKGATEIAKKFNISEMLIGIIIVGLGTSLPEMIITITSSISGHPDLIIGNALGSCICNLLLVIGIASLFRPLKIDERLQKVHLPLSLVAVIILLIVTNFGNSYEITRLEGTILLIITIVYLIYTCFEGKKENAENKKALNKEFKSKEAKKRLSLITIILHIVVGFIALKYGADFVVDSATQIARDFKVSESLISLTIIAIGTALPEIVTSIIASIKQDADLAMGNVIGSNIFNLLLLPSLGAVISPMVYDIKFNTSILFIFLIILYMTLSGKIKKHKGMITRKKGIILLIIYLIYIVRMIIIH